MSHKHQRYKVNGTQDISYFGLAGWVAELQSRTLVVDHQSSTPLMPESAIGQDLEPFNLSPSLTTYFLDIFLMLSSHLLLDFPSENFT
jgi:hypothetical protein